MKTELLEIKEEPIDMALASEDIWEKFDIVEAAINPPANLDVVPDDSFSEFSNSEDFGLFEEFSLGMEESLRFDCMWSPGILTPGSGADFKVTNKRSRRDSTLSLLECAESLFKDVDLTVTECSPNTLDSLMDNSSTDQGGGGGRQALETDEEIDVVSADPSSSSKVRLPGKSLLRNPPMTKRCSTVNSRSLLLTNRINMTTILDHSYGDHSYHSIIVPPGPTAIKEFSVPLVQTIPPLKTAGILTPTESEDEEEEKSKLTPPKTDNVKFKFRMKFKSDSHQRSLLTRGTTKRNSASKNSYCPDQSGEEPEETSKKCREIRDLHNSMERQRRVDLRNNFNQLKFVVPELKGMDKASKLNILNKSAEYCKYLNSIDIKLQREKEIELNRKFILQKKLSGLQNSTSRHSRISIFK